jgi:hypothetical protein
MPLQRTTGSLRDLARVQIVASYIRNQPLAMLAAITAWQ